MKKIIAATLVAGLFASAGAFAAPTTVTLVTGYNSIGDVATDINIARQFTLTAIASRAGFIKNSFDATLSANVVAGVVDDAANNRLGVVAGSNKGYTVFTGSSVGGSVSQCGDPVAKTVTNLAASLVLTGTVDLTKANGCNRTPT